MYDHSIDCKKAMWPARKDDKADNAIMHGLSYYFSCFFYPTNLNMIDGDDNGSVEVDCDDEIVSMSNILYPSKFKIQQYQSASIGQVEIQCEGVEFGTMSRLWIERPQV